jgi:hypothetical protein
VLVVCALLLVAALFGASKGLGLKTRIMRLFKPEYGLPVPVAHFITSPVNNERDVRTHTAVSFTIHVRNGTLDSNTLPKAHVELVPQGGGATIPVILKPAGTDLLIVRPSAELSPQTTYLATISGLKSGVGATIKPFTTKFTTGRMPDPSIRFQKITLANTADHGFTDVTMGPGHMLYAGTDEGVIYRYPIGPDGRLGEAQEIRSLQTANGGGKRLLIGICFDPASTESNPIVWVTHSFYAFEGAPDFTGKLTRMSGPNLENVQDVVIHLPRSARDHMTNQPSFGPDGAIYFPEGASSSYGAPDHVWSNREEHLLTAAILRLDVTKVMPGQPLDALTVDAGGTYDPRTPDAPLTVYAIGLRNAYDLVWTSRGQLYSAVNGAQPPGNTPAGGGAPALFDIPLDENDWLFHIIPGSDAAHPHYYGHPNPQWNHFVLNGGNPAPSDNPAQMPLYPVGTQPDPDWRPAAYDFGPHVSADGTIEYKSDAFGGKLQHMLIVCRYNAGSDLIAIKLKDDDSGVDYTLTGIPGWTNLNAPLDICEDTTPANSGNLYVAEYGGRCITLMRPITAASK